MNIQVTGDAQHSILVTGSHNLIVQAGQVLIQAAEQARRQGRDPTRMLRILAVLAAPVYDPHQPEHPPPPLDLKQEWHKLAEDVRGSHDRQAPILLTRLTPPTLETLRIALSPGAETRQTFPHILHFSGHAWKDGLLLEDEFGQVHRVPTAELLQALKSMPHPLDLVVLNACETAADEARSLAQALIRNGLARAVIGHTAPVWDPQAIAFAAALYAELTHGFPLTEALERAKTKITTHEVLLLGDQALRFEHLEQGEPLIEDHRPAGNLPSRLGSFFGRGLDLVKIARALEHPPAVVLIHGASGIGKSSLALEAAHRNAWRFPGGVAYAEGTDAESGQPTTCRDLLLKLAQSLNLPTSPESLEEDLRQYTVWQPTLLVLDNLDGLEGREAQALANFLRHLDAESAAIVTRRTSCTPLEALPTAHPHPLQHGIGAEAARRYALELSPPRSIPLTPRQVGTILAATDDHPRLIELVVAQAGRRDLDDLLEEVRERKGDFAAQLQAVYAWSAARLDEAGRAAWQALLLFPAGAAPERVLREAASPQGLEALREAALADFYPAEQLWRWHASVAEYARTYRPLQENERQARWQALLPAWTAWLERLKEKTEAERQARLDPLQANLSPLLQAAEGGRTEQVLPFLRALGAALPAPDRTLSLRALQERLYRLWAEKAEEAAERARALGMLGNALSALGRREEALQAAQEAVDLYRPLAQANPQAFLPYLAAGLNNLGNWLSELGWREEALQATQEAVDLYRPLTQAHPQAFLPYLAAGLNNLGNRLSELGRREEALQAAQEAAAFYRQLAQAHPQAFLPDLARSLHNLGTLLAELGRREEALQAAQKAVEFYRPLAQAQPQAFLPYLAAGLNNLGLWLSALGRREEALQAVQEAAELYRQLAQAHPHAFLPELARSLNNLGAVLSALGRREEALQAAQEAVDLYRQLAQAHPQAFLPYLAASLHNLGKMLSELGRREEALQAAQKAIDLYRPLAQAHPQAFLPELARSLNNLGAVLSALGRREEALQAAQEAVDLYRQLAQTHPQAFLPYLAASLHNLGTLLAELGRQEEALQAAQEAVAICRQLAQTHPQAFLPYLAASLHNLGTLLAELGRREEALQAAQEAVDIYRPLAQAHPQAFLPDLASSLHNLGTLLAELGRREEALRATQEAVELYRQLAQAQSQAFLPYLAAGLNNLGLWLSALGQREEALQAVQEAAELYRQLAQAHSQAFLPYLARSLNNLGTMLAELGRWEEALQAAQEAVDLYRPLAQANPQAFLPDLATSLGAYGSILLALERLTEAAESFAEGARLLLPFARALPQAFSGLLRALLRDYLRACQAAGHAPQPALLQQATEILGKHVE